VTDAVGDELGRWRTFDERTVEYIGSFQPMPSMADAERFISGSADAGALEAALSVVAVFLVGDAHHAA
jgi:hypothetical protein